MYKLNDDKCFYDISEGQAVIIDYISGMYYGTSTLGSVVLDRILAGNDPAEVAEALAAIPGSPDNMKDQVDEFVKVLVEKEIVVEGPSTQGGNAPIEEAALVDGLIFTLDEFAEVQDLLLADPVHDVDVEMGWPMLKGDE